MKKFNNQLHGFHLVDPSPWPFVAAFSTFTLAFGAVMFFHGYSGGLHVLQSGFQMILTAMFFWWRDIIRESTFEGRHTAQVINGLRLGVILFIISEIMFFFGFFWAFFSASLNPTFYIGGVWPPKFLTILSAWEIPLLNTILLLSSGATVTWSHHAIIAGNKPEAKFALISTILLAVLFTLLQAYEYVSAPFTISDGIYGSIFYMITGFHGFHVVVGTIFLFVCLVRLTLNHFTREHHFGFEAAAWYWHFVDVVWLFLFITVYWWGS